MMSVPPTLEVENLGKRYRLGRMTPHESLARVLGRARTADPNNHHWALRNVSFTLHRGDVLGVVGANGAGKSTLLKLMSRVTRPTEGRALIRGRVGSLLEVGTGFHPELTGMENVFINGAILGMSRKEIRSRMPDILEFAGIGKYIDTPVKRYSSGMYTRLAFAVAAHLEPEVLIVDEVLAVGDAAFQKRCLDKMHDAAMSGRTILFVSHGAGNVQKLCNKALLLENGEPTAFGAVENVLEKYTGPTEACPPPTPEIALPPALRNPPVVALTLRFSYPDGTPSAQFPLGAPWRAEMDLRVHRPASNVVTGLGLVTDDGQPVLTSWPAPIDFEPGDYRVTFDFEPVLKATGISFTVGLSRENETLYYAAGQGRVEIGPDAVGQAASLPHPTAASGLLIHRGAVDVQRLSQAGDVVAAGARR